MLLFASIARPTSAQIFRTATPAMCGYRKSFKKAMNYKYSELCENSIAREFCGLLDAGTLEPG